MHDPLQKTTPGPGTPSGSRGLVRNLSVWQAVGLSVALMAPSMAANINPQGTAGLAGRAVPRRRARPGPRSAVEVVAHGCCSSVVSVRNLTWSDPASTRAPVTVCLARRRAAPGGGGTSPR